MGKERVIKGKRKIIRVLESGREGERESDRKGKGKIPRKRERKRKE